MNVGVHSPDFKYAVLLGQSSVLILTFIVTPKIYPVIARYSEMRWWIQTL